jgi:ABC-type polysaccharide transport system permease subunit
MTQMNFSLATAASMFKAVIGLTLVVSANSIAKKLTAGEHGVW